MIIRRPYWQERIEQAWQKRTIVWLMGVRRVGKTSLCKSLDNVEYYDCERPKVRQLVEDPEAFLASKKGKRIVLDEIHRLDNPSELLKIAADHYPEVKIIATGSSTLGASAKFKDTLAGRRRQVWLTPLLLQEMGLFGSEDIRHRFLFGGLPGLFEQKEIDAEEFKDWMDAYWAKDIQEMFSVGKRHSFLKFAELLLAQSSGQFEATRFAAACEVSRQTIGNYLSILEETFVVHVIRPFSTRKAKEIIRAPKVYGFDTGFVCYYKGWEKLRSADTGFLWEHCVLNELQALLQTRTINYWRNKRGNEVDFVLPRKRSTKIIDGIECKFSIKANATIADTVENFEGLRTLYPQGENYVVAHDIVEPFTRQHNGIILNFVGVNDLIERLR